MNGYVNQYQNNQIATASREQILLMLYDGAIRFCKQAKKGLEDGNLEIKGRYIGKVMAILAELSNSLDHEIGGEIASNLDALYNFMQQEMTKANVKNDTGPIDTVCSMLCELRATWAEAIEINNVENAVGSVSFQHSLAAI